MPVYQKEAGAFIGSAKRLGTTTTIADEPQGKLRELWRPGIRVATTDSRIETEGV
jgi:hypothetical protein